MTKPTPATESKPKESAKQEPINPTDIKATDVHYRLKNETVGKIMAFSPLVGTILSLVPVGFILYLVHHHQEMGDITDFSNCTIFHFLPSIRMFSGTFPLAAFWKFGIFFHTAPRIAAGFMYYNLYMEIAPKRLCRLYFWSYYLEVFGLLMISYVTLMDDFIMHYYVRILYVIAAFLTTISAISIVQSAPEKWKTKGIQRGFRLKVVSLVLLVIGTSGRIYSNVYEEHEMSCIGHTFDRLAIYEYCIGIAALMFHYTFKHDFAGGYFINCQIADAERQNELKKDK